MRPYEKLLRCYDCFREKIDFQPLIGMTLGSGLGDYADGIDHRLHPRLPRYRGLPRLHRPGPPGPVRLRLCGGGPRRRHAGTHPLL